MVNHRYIKLAFMCQLSFFMTALLLLSTCFNQLAFAQNPKPLSGALYIEDKARGLRFEPPLMCIHFLPSDPKTIIIGNRLGRIYQSEDGGESWLEGSVLTPRNLFLGAEYQHYTPPMLSISLLNEGILPSPGQLFSFQNLIDLDQKLPQAGGLVRSYFNTDVEGSSEINGFMSKQWHGRASFRLAQEVYNKTKFKLGVSWRDSITDKANNSIAVKYIATPHNRPNEIIVATEAGLYHSRDGGDSWPISFGGLNSSERNVNVVKINPYRPNEVWIGTKGGLRISRDGGNTYNVANHRFVTRANIQWISFDPADPQKIYLGLDWSMVYSKDGGETYQIGFYNTYPALSNIRRIFIDPHHPERILLGTNDGLMISLDGAKTFKRGGGLLFIGQPVVDLIQGFSPGHYLLATEQDLWQSFDGGTNWQIAYFGAVDWHIRMLKRSPNIYGELWVLTSAEILKLSSRPPPPSNLQGYSELKARLQREPSMSEVVNSALIQAGFHRESRLRIEQKARVSTWLPRLDAFFASRNAGIGFALKNYLLKDTGEITNENDGLFTYSVWGAFLHWDLYTLIYHRGEVPIHDRESRLRRRESVLRSFVINLYQERFNLLTALQLDPRDQRTTLMRNLRLEELTAHLNKIAGDLFPPVDALKMIKRVH
jgi:hypothetical protein